MKIAIFLSKMQSPLPEPALFPASSWDTNRLAGIGTVWLGYQPVAVGPCGPMGPPLAHGPMQIDGGGGRVLPDGWVAGGGRRAADGGRRAAGPAGQGRSG